MISHLSQNHLESQLFITCALLISPRFSLSTPCQLSALRQTPCSSSDRMCFLLPWGPLPMIVLCMGYWSTPFSFLHRFIVWVSAEASRVSRSLSWLLAPIDGFLLFFDHGSVHCHLSCFLVPLLLLWTLYGVRTLLVHITVAFYDDKHSGNAISKWKNKFFISIRNTN